MAPVTTSTRFQLLRDDGVGTSEVAAFGTFDEAESYQDDLGTPVKHVRFNIVDRSKNLIVDAADDTERAALDKRMALAKDRALLIAQEEANAKREAALKAGLVPA